MNGPTAQTRQTTGSPTIRSEQTELQPAADIVEYCKDYAREKPEVVALWCFGVGFILGWKLKPW